MVGIIASVAVAVVAAVVVAVAAAHAEVAEVASTEAATVCKYFDWKGLGWSVNKAAATFCG